MPCLASSSTCSARRRSANSPPWILGCSVFTRPPSISGNAVTSSTSVTGNPASRNVCAVPPDETSVAPSSTSARPSSTIPVLSYTVSRALLTGRTSPIGGVPHPHVSPVHVEPTLDQRADRSRKLPMLGRVDPQLERVPVVVGQHLD